IFDVLFLVCFFFFQAEDGIRDRTVTGVQTCALPIFWPGGAGFRPRGASTRPSRPLGRCRQWPAARAVRVPCLRARPSAAARPLRSEERRVGKEWRSRWWPYHYKKRDESYEGILMLCR